MEDSRATVEDLVVAHQAGDAGALDRLVRCVQPRLLRLATSILRDPIAAEDAFVAAMAGVLPRARHFETPVAFEAYMRRAVRNAAVDAYRRRSDRDSRRALIDTDRMKRRAAEGFDDVVERLPSALPDPEQALLRARRHALLREAVVSLREPGRTTIRLFYEDDMTYDEIAAKIGVSSATVKRQLGAARLLLAARMRAAEEGHRVH